MKKYSDVIETFKKKKESRKRTKLYFYNEEWSKISIEIKEILIQK